MSSSDVEKRKRLGVGFVEGFFPEVWKVVLTKSLRGVGSEEHGLWDRASVLGEGRCRDVGMQARKRSSFLAGGALSLSCLPS